MKKISRTELNDILFEGGGQPSDDRNSSWEVDFWKDGKKVATKVFKGLWKTVKGMIRQHERDTGTTATERREKK